LLEVDSLAQAVGADQDPRWGVGEGGDAGLAIFRREAAGDGLDSRGLGQPCAQLTGQVLGGGDEAAENDGMVTIAQQGAEHDRGLLQLFVFVAGQGLGLRRHGQQDAPPGGIAAFVVGIRAASGRGIHGLRVLAGGVLDRAAADRVRGLDGLRGHNRGAIAEGGGRGGRAAGQGAQHGQRRPQTDALAQRAAFLVADQLPRVGDRAAEQGLVIRMEAVAFLALLARGKRGRGVQILLDVGAAALHEVGGERDAVALMLRAGKVGGKVGECRVEQAEQRAEGALVAAVRRCGHEDQMPARVRGQALNQLTALVRRGARRAGVGAGVGFIHDDQLRAGAEEIGAAAVGFDVIGGDDEEAVNVEQGLVHAACRLQPPGRGRQHEFGVKRELLGELALPLLGQMRGAQNGDAADIAPVKHLAGDHTSLDGLADANVVREQEANGLQAQPHEQGDELVGTGLEGDPAEGAERACAGTEAEADRIAEEAGGAKVAEVGGGGRGEGGGGDDLQRGVDAGDLFVSAAQGTQDEEVIGGFGQDHPFPPTGGDEGAGGETHAWPPFAAAAATPKTEGYSPISRSHSA
jgi:hypothetical protein